MMRVTLATATVSLALAMMIKSPMATEKSEPHIDPEVEIHPTVTLSSPLENSPELIRVMVDAFSPECTERERELSRALWPALTHCSDTGVDRFADLGILIDTNALPVPPPN